MADHDIALMAHLMRRAGFGAQYDELEARAAKGYEATVEELLHPEDHPNGWNSIWRNGTSSNGIISPVAYRNTARFA